jgi:transposase
LNLLQILWSGGQYRQKVIGSYDEQIKQIEGQIQEHLKKHPGLKRSVELLESIAGIGRRSSTILVCELHSEALGEKKISAKAQTAHAGLAPQEKTSGTSVRGKRHICRVGNARLRKSLYFPAMSAIRYNPVVREFYKRLVDKGKPKKVALVAAMRKLLVIVVGVLNNGVPFDPDWATHKKLAFAT